MRPEVWGPRRCHRRLWLDNATLLPTKWGHVCSFLYSYSSFIAKLWIKSAQQNKPHKCEWCFLILRTNNLSYYGNHQWGSCARYSEAVYPRLPPKDGALPQGNAQGVEHPLRHSESSPNKCRNSLYSNGLMPQTMVDTCSTYSMPNKSSNAFFVLSRDTVCVRNGSEQGLAIGLGLQLLFYSTQKKGVHRGRRKCEALRVVAESSLMALLSMSKLKSVWAIVLRVQI